MAIRLTRRGRSLGTILPLFGLLTLVAPQLRAASPITYHDIAENDGAGISFRRIKSPIMANFDAIKIRPFYDTGANVEAPWRPHGSPGVALIDYDRDGDLDIYVTNGPGRANSLYQNQNANGGGLTFIDKATAAGVDATDMDSTGTCFGDIDNDGDDDLYVLGRMEPNRLFINNGNGSFTIKTDAGTDGGFMAHTSCSMGDIDGDGLLDIMVSNTFDWARMDAIFKQLFSFSMPNLLFHNKGSNVFEDVSESSGIHVLENVPPGDGTISWSTAMVDYDQDGDMDIMHSDDQAAMLPSFLAGVDRGFIQIHNNDGTGHFTNVTKAAGTNNPMAWMGLSYGDVNCDGLMDMFVTNIGAYLIPQQGGSVPPFIASSQWYIGRPGGFVMGGFLDQTLGGLKGTPFGWGTGMTDVDNDGDTDIVFSGCMDQGALIYGDNPGTVLLNNDCSATFTWDRAATEATSERTRRSEVIGMALGDLNGDGFTDMVYAAAQYAPPTVFPLIPFFQRWGSPFDAVATHVPTFMPIGPQEFEWAGHDTEDGHMFVLVSSANENHWVKAILKGSKSLTPAGKVNRDGIGAIVYFTPSGGKRVMSPVLGGSSHESEHALEQSFGLGAATSGLLEVMWPGKVRNRLYNVASGERVTLPEIPCSYDTSQTKKQYTTCVNTALNDLVHAGIITQAEKKRLSDSAQQAYTDAH